MPVSHGARLLPVAMAAALLASCQRPPAPESPLPENLVAAPATTPSPATNGQDSLVAFSVGGAQAFSALQEHQDIHHGTAWYQGNVPATGSTAYLYLGKLGEGASTLRFVVRHEGPRAANFGNCTVIVDGIETGSFSLVPNKFENLPAGKVMQLADTHFDAVRPIVLAMINGRSAVIRTGDGAEIRLGRPELDDMRRVLSAYLHLQGQP